MDCITNLEDSLYNLEAAIKRAEKRLATAPEGQINLKTRNGTVIFYQHLSTGQDLYLGKDKKSLIKALAQKKYDKEILNTFQHEKLAIERTLKGLEGNSRFKSEEQVWQDFPSVLKEYVTQDPITHEGSIQKWKNQTWRLKDGTSKYKYFSLKGERVRSKSEVIIADRLFNAGIPYHYEKILELGPAKYGMDTIYPDFTILDTKTLKVYYWEHMGMLGDEKYASDAKHRLEQYADANLFPGKDIILTFETNTSPLNLVYVDMLIKTYFA